jgi:hypothetical protein
MSIFALVFIQLIFTIADGSQSPVSKCVELVKTNVGNVHIEQYNQATGASSTVVSFFE